jgi:hypothetical protein
VQTIDAIDVKAASGPEHHLRPRRAALGGMRGEVVNPLVSFRFNVFSLLTTVSSIILALALWP